MDPLGLRETRYFAQYPSFLKRRRIGRTRNQKRNAAGEVLAAGGWWGNYLRLI